MFVYRFLSTGSIEEKVYQRQLSKEGLKQLVSKTGEADKSSSGETMGGWGPRGEIRPTRTETHFMQGAHMTSMVAAKCNTLKHTHTHMVSVFRRCFTATYCWTGKAAANVMTAEDLRELFSLNADSWSDTNDYMCGGPGLPDSTAMATEPIDLTSVEDAYDDINDASPGAIGATAGRGAA